MPRPHKTVNSSKRVFRGVPDRVVGLLYSWAEWRTIADSPKSPGMPEPQTRWDKKGCAYVGTPVFMPMISSTAPRQVRAVEELNQCMLAMRKAEPDYHFCLIALIECTQEPWPEGKKWLELRRGTGLNLRELETALNSALRSLAERARARGLL